MLKGIHARWPSKDLPEERREKKHTKGLRVVCWGGSRELSCRSEKARVWEVERVAGEDFAELFKSRFADVET